MKRMTLEYSPYPKIASLKKTVFFQCLYEVDGTGGIEPAGGREHGRYEFLIESNDQDHYGFHLDLPL